MITSLPLGKIFSVAAFREGGENPAPRRRRRDGKKRRREGSLHRRKLHAKSYNIPLVKDKGIVYNGYGADFLLCGRAVSCIGAWGMGVPRALPLLLRLYAYSTPYSTE